MILCLESHLFNKKSRVIKGIMVGAVKLCHISSFTCYYSASLECFQHPDW